MKKLFAAALAAVSLLAIAPAAQAAAQVKVGVLTCTVEPRHRPSSSARPRT